MGVLFFLIPLALVVVTAGVLAFRWALTDGQLDDLDTPSLRALVDDPSPGPAAIRRAYNVAQRAQAPRIPALTRRTSR